MHNQLAVITGATGGIGSEYAKQLAAKGYELLLIDIDQEKTEKLAASLRAMYSVAVGTLQCDLVNEASVTEMADKLQQIHKIDMLVNAAGYGEKKLFHEDKMGNIMNLVRIHLSSTLQAVHAVLPGMVQRGSGSIVVLSSLGSFIPAAGSSVYSACKAFLNTFMESLHLELGDKGIILQSLCPGLTRTGFHSAEDVARLPKIDGFDVWMEAKDVVRISLENLEKDKVVCVPGLINKGLHAAAWFLPKNMFYHMIEHFQKPNVL